MNRAGIKDIANKANVSIGTVDRVLHGRGQVSEKTKKLVLQVIKELNYKPNTMASSLASKRTYVISALLPEPLHQNNYWYYPASGIEKALLEYKDINVELLPFYYRINSKKDFEHKAQLVLDNKPDGVITTPIYNELANYIPEMERLNIKYAFIDSDLTATHRSFYIGQNTFQSGRVAAQLLHYSLKSSTSNILLLRVHSTFQGAPAIKQREQGFEQYLREVSLSKNLEIKSIAQKSDEDIKDKVLEIFESQQNLSAVFIPNSKSHLIAPYLRGMGKNKPLLLGFDMLEQNRELLKEGLIDFLISQRPIQQGYEAFQHLLKFLIEKKNIAVIKSIPIDIITKENLSAYDHLNV